MVFYIGIALIPLVILVAIGFVYFAAPSDRGGIKSELQIAILKAFRAGGVELSPPQDVRLVGSIPQAKNA